MVNDDGGFVVPQKDTDALLLWWWVTCYLSGLPLEKTPSRVHYTNGTVSTVELPVSGVGMVKITLKMFGETASGDTPWCMAGYSREYDLLVLTPIQSATKDGNP